MRAAIATSPRNAVLHHALGLALTRLKQTDAALAELRRARSSNQIARYAYVYAVALHSSAAGEMRPDTAEGDVGQTPDDRDALMALISFSREAGDAGNALAYATRLEQISPDPQLARLIEELRGQATKPNPARNTGR